MVFREGLVSVEGDDGSAGGVQVGVVLVVLAAGHRVGSAHLDVSSSASKKSIRRFVITEKAPTRAFSWLKVATTAFTFKTLLRHYAKQMLTHGK